MKNTGMVEVPIPAYAFENHRKCHYTMPCRWSINPMQFLTCIGFAQYFATAESPVQRASNKYKKWREK